MRRVRVEPFARCFVWVLMPLRMQAVFFVFMTLLMCGSFFVHYGTLRNAAFFGELWVDLYLLCLLLSLLPRRVAGIVRVSCSAVSYILVTVDGYCSMRFGAGISPTMLQLVAETTPAEAGDFFEGYVFRMETFRAVAWPVGIGLLHAGCLWGRKRIHRWLMQWLVYVRRGVGRRIDSICWQEWGGMALALSLLFCGWLTMPVRLTRAGVFEQTSVYKLERYLNGYVSSSLYTPLHRLAFSLFAHQLSARDLQRLHECVEQTRVDSCSRLSPHIVLIIGESYNKHHSQLYGYGMPTTPRQMERWQRGELFVFTDVVTSWNITSQVFKNMFSLHSVDQPGSWTDATLFPAVFRKAGYRVAFLTNQFAPSVGEDIFGFSGSFFMNDPELSRMLFDWRNKKSYLYDDALLACYDAQRKLETEYNLTLFHLWGQHMIYHHRMPSRRRILKAKDEPRPELSANDRQWVANYDNATLFNDSVVDGILARYEDREAVVIYVSDHGEEVHDELPEFGRNPDRDPTPPIARAEYEVPFWIWCSADYRAHHPDVVERIRQAVNRPFMTDDLSHLLLRLGGISCPGYDATRDVIDERYNAGRKRMLRGKYDYDVMKTADY
ncbi:MAG: lipid A phosphoethanolamine transferase [Clostridium sp.]|nr:lipid A phosphoethanolamine transferase [Clostridium sp.]